MSEAECLSQIDSGEFIQGRLSYLLLAQVEPHQK